MLRDAKIVSYKTEAHGSLSVSALQLKYKKLFLLQQQKSKKIDVLTKTGTIQKGVNHSASTTSDGPGLGFQQFMLYMDTVSHLIHDQFGKKLGLEENLINFHSESVKGNASIGSFASYGLTMGLDCRYITLETLFSNLCRSKGSELEINSTLRGTEICRSGMTKVAKTAFDKAGSFQLLDPNYSVLNVITSSSSDGGLTPGLQDGISILLRDISVFAVASDDAGEDDHPVACCEYPATPPGVNVFYGSTRVVHLWSMNAEQIRQIFWYYARSVDLNRHSKLKSQQLSNGIHVDYNHTTGSGANNNGSNCGTVGVSMLTFENCKECLMDFGIVPKYIDLVTLTRVFRSVKLWEWYMGELYLIDRLVTAATLNQPVNTSPKDELSSVHMNINLSQVLNLDTTQCFHDTFPYDFTTSLGNLSLTIW